MACILLNTFIDNPDYRSAGTMVLSGTAVLVLIYGLLPESYITVVREPVARWHAVFER